MPDRHEPERRVPPRGSVLSREIPAWLMAVVPMLVAAGILGGISALDARYLHAEAFAQYQYQMQLQHQRDSLLKAQNDSIVSAKLEHIANKLDRKP